MATMTAPPAPPSPPSGEYLRHPNIYANLMPDEVVAARDARKLKRQVFAGLGLLVALLVVLYGLSVVQTAHARGQRSSAESQTTKLQKQVQRFAPLVTAQNQSKAIYARLADLMKSDIDWTEWLKTVRKTPNGIALASAQMNLTIGTNAKPTQQLAGQNVLNQTGKPSIGSMTIVGEAVDKSAIAAYVDSLGKIRGFAAPFPSSVTLSGHVYKFTISVIVTSDLFGGRYTKTSPQGGK